MKSRGSVDGFRELIYDDGFRLSLPTRVCNARQVEIEAAREAEREVLRRELAEKGKGQEQVAVLSETLRSSFPTEPAAGKYRVLRDFERRFVKGDAELIGSTPDQDVIARQRRIVQRLRQLGPDRTLAAPTFWQRELALLESAMPHFAEPLRCVKRSLIVADVTGGALRIPPMLLLGPPGVGKTYFSKALANLLEAPHATVSFDQPTAGSSLRGADSYWSNTRTGLLFDLICMGSHANPVVLLDELDKSARRVVGAKDVDPLAQLLSALEPESARSLTDISVGIEFDASQTTYIATANTTNGLEQPLLSRFEVFLIQQPTPEQSLGLAEQVTSSVVTRLGLADRVAFEHGAHLVLTHFDARRMRIFAERALVSVVEARRERVCEEDIWAAIEPASRRPTVH